MLEDSLFVISLFKDTEKTEVLPVIRKSGISCNLLHSLLSTNKTMIAKLCISPATNFNWLHANIFRCLCKCYADWMNLRNHSTYLKPWTVEVWGKGLVSL